ncbi:MAG: Asp-tRNA(Asn)/Glu-tRNA(Gln) amidotransferase subunit GatC [Clostridia bacterium]|nr:Asp-tRNA(Asn)/Glu-tRNA(Gln) amidotransferase subunit GatC [Clostridia bacterium]
MDYKELRLLEMLNQLSLSDAQKSEMLEFFEKRESDLVILNELDTESVERMVHVMPISTVVREDIASQPFDRDELQRGAPNAELGYWCVPRVVD